MQQLTTSVQKSSGEDSTRTSLELTEKCVEIKPCAAKCDAVVACNSLPSVAKQLSLATPSNNTQPSEISPQKPSEVILASEEASWNGDQPSGLTAWPEPPEISDAKLCEILRAWPRLPENIRNAISLIIEPWIFASEEAPVARAQTYSDSKIHGAQFTSQLPLTESGTISETKEVKRGK